jgi:hypothetical protein
MSLPVNYAVRHGWAAWHGRPGGKGGPTGVRHCQDMLTGVVAGLCEREQAETDLVRLANAMSLLNAG